MTEAWTDTKVSVCTSVFLFIKVNAMYLHNCFDDHESVDKTCVACFINCQNRGQKIIVNRKEEKDENRH